MDLTKLSIDNGSELGDFSVYRGWSDQLAADIVLASQDPVVQKFTPKDANQRFMNQVSANDWYRKKRPFFYSLVRDSTLAGVIWFSPNRRDELGCDYTFAIRMYSLARGKHLSLPFATLAEADFRASTSLRGIWLETDVDNIAAQKLYKTLGYHTVTTRHNRITMCKK